MDGCGYPSTSNIIQLHPSTSIHIQVFYITATDYRIMAISQAIDSLRDEIRENLIERNLEDDPDVRWLAPQDLATKALNSQLISLFSLLSGDNWTVEVRNRQKEYFKVLLILVRSGCSDRDLQRLRRESLVVGDEDLPVDRATAINMFGEKLGASFYSEQFTFCAVKFKDGEETKYLGDVRQKCPLPFESRERLGGGSSGAVYKVKVLASHFCSKDYGMGPNEKVCPAVTDTAVAYHSIAITLCLERVYTMWEP
jgi:hypothetical protein